MTFMSIRAKLILATTIPLLIIYVLVLGWDYYKSQQLAQEQSEQIVAERAGGAAAQVNAHLAAIQEVVDSTASALTNRPTLSDVPLGRYLGGALRSNTWIAAFWIAFDPVAPSRTPPGPLISGFRRTPNGNSGITNIGPEFEKTDAFAQAWFTQTKAVGKPHWFEPEDFTVPDGGKSCIYASPFFNTEGKFIGVVCAEIKTADLQYLRNETPIMQRLRRILGREPVQASQPTTEPTPRPIDEGGYLLIDHHGDMISHPDGEVVHGIFGLAQKSGYSDLSLAIDRALGEGTGEIVVATGLDKLIGGFKADESYVLAIEPLASTGWLYVTAVPESELMAPIQDRLVKRGLFLLASLFVLVGVLMFVIARFCRPIEQMAATVEHLARGELDIEPVPVLARDELGQLARGFNAMTRQLRDHVAALTEQTAEREKVQSELRIARQIQRDLLPSKFPPFPDRAEFNLHAVNIPARHIAGDFFDFFFINEDLLTVTIADVSGKGVPAALMMAVTRTIVRNLALAGLSPLEIAERTNRTLIEDTNPGLFVTMVLGQYRPSTGELTYVNAGHPPAVRYREHAAATTCCASTSPLLGVVNDGALGPFEQASLTLERGEGILLYTDGVTEAHDAHNVFYGESRLLKQITTLSDRNCPNLCELLVKDVMHFQSQNATDDLTLVSLQRA